jgi:hypothetical protein
MKLDVPPYNNRCQVQDLNKSVNCRKVPEKIMTTAMTAFVVLSVMMNSIMTRYRTIRMKLYRTILTSIFPRKRSQITMIVFSTQRTT